MRKPDIFENIRQDAPSHLVDFLNQAMVLFPDEFRYRLKWVLRSLPREGDNMQRVLELVRSQWVGIQSQEWVKIAIVGPGRTGKATLLDAILREEGDAPREIFTVVETSGLEEFLGYDKRDWAVELTDADLILLVLDGRYGVSESTLQMVEGLNRLERPVMVLLNKMDMVEKPGQALREARRILGDHVFGLSSVRLESVDRLLKRIVQIVPRALYPLTVSFPSFRKAICRGIVTQSAISASVVCAVPIPVDDILPLLAIQTAMVLKIARAFGHRLDNERARELIPVLLAGALVRQGNHWLTRQFPAQKRIISITVGGLWTYTLGRAAVSYFESFSTGMKKIRQIPAMAPALAAD